MRLNRTCMSGFLAIGLTLAQSAPFVRSLAYAQQSAGQEEVEYLGRQETRYTGLQIDGLQFTLSTGLVPAEKREDILPPDAYQLLTELEQIAPDRLKTIEVALQRLQTRQNTYTRLGYLDEAAAIRDCIAEYRARQAGVQNDPGTLTAYRGQSGKVLYFTVTGNTHGSVYGTGLYTDDSTLAAAVVHAGLLEEGKQGTIKVTIRDGQNEYTGSEQHGVTSSSYAAWQGSYSVASADLKLPEPKDALPPEAKVILDEIAPYKANGLREMHLREGLASLKSLQNTYSHAEKLEEALAIRDAILHCVGDVVGAKENGRLTDYRNQVGQTLYFYATGRGRGSVWGSDLYTDDSDLGTVAVHAGLLRRGQKGIVRVTFFPGAEHYDSSIRNGVTSMDYQVWQGSFRIANLSL